MPNPLRDLSWAGWAVVGILIALIVLLAWCSYDGRRGEREAEEARRVDVGTLQRDQAARDKAADARLSDTQSAASREKERADATATLPDAAPSPRRVARACVQLRQQGTRDADLPAACRSPG
jgi:hypothetical protein